MLDALRAYDELLWDGRLDRTDAYRQLLEDQPWKRCPCGICGTVGIDVVDLPRLGTKQAPRLPQPLRLPSTAAARTRGHHAVTWIADLTSIRKDTMGHRELLRVPALEIRQGPNRVLYSFAVDGKQLPRFTTISRIHRDDATHIQGYQRPEVLSHISAIRRYLESPDPMIPNALVVAFDSRVQFEPQPAEALRCSSPGKARWSSPSRTPGRTPTSPDGSWTASSAAPPSATPRSTSFPICVTAFITDSDTEQRSQFILVNSTKPLPKGLIYELLPATSGTLPTSLQLRRFPAYLLDRLNHDEDSPLREADSDPHLPRGRHQGQLGAQDAGAQHQRRGALPVPRSCQRRRRRPRRCLGCSNPSGERSRTHSQKRGDCRRASPA